MTSTSPDEPLVSTVDGPARHATFFERERDRLISEVSQGIESLVSTSNALNRKMEESISVGKEFQPIAGLWGRFVDLMTAAGIPNPYEEDHSSSDPTPSLPPGVAPGGGIVYSHDEEHLSNPQE